MFVLLMYMEIRYVLKMKGMSTCPAAIAVATSGYRRWSDMENLLQDIASGLWVVLGVYCFFELRKWNKRFRELYDELKGDVERWND